MPFSAAFRTPQLSLLQNSRQISSLQGPSLQKRSFRPSAGGSSSLTRQLLSPRPVVMELTVQASVTPKQQRKTTFTYPQKTEQVVSRKSATTQMLKSIIKPSASAINLKPLTPRSRL